MKNLEELVILRKDYERLLSLVGRVQGETSELLEDELNRARVVETSDDMSDVVRMNSVVTFKDESSLKELTMQLAYPGDTSESDNIQKISILAPVGAALIGLRIGGSIDWPLPNGKMKKLKVLFVKNV